MTETHVCPNCGSVNDCDAQPARQADPVGLRNAIDRLDDHLETVYGISPGKDGDYVYGGRVVDIVKAAQATSLPDQPVEPGPLDARPIGDGYEVRVWQKHEPSGVVVLTGHPQLGGRYCLTDGGDWPCSAVQAASLPAQPVEPGPLDLSGLSQSQLLDLYDRSADKPDTRSAIEAILRPRTRLSPDKQPKGAG